VAVLIRVYSTIVKFKLLQGRIAIQLLMTFYLTALRTIPVKPFYTHRLAWTIYFTYNGITKRQRDSDSTYVVEAVA